MFRDKRFIYWSLILVLLIIVNIVGFHGLQENGFYFQKEKESVLPDNKNSGTDGNIRVLIKTNGFQQQVHTNIQLCAESGLIINNGKETKEYASLDKVAIAPDNALFDNGTIKVACKNDSDKIQILSLERGCGIPSYRGTLELFLTAEGIVVINELSLEEYLYAVVPSEMPASFELEALKAQAVCARSYAYNQTRNYSYPEYQAHVDDSTSFQVYGNSREQESTICAVNETAGEKIWYNAQVATAYYYSTSCGVSASIQAWGNTFNENNQYLQSIKIDNAEGEPYEKRLPWYRWTAEIPVQTLHNLIELNTGEEIGTVQSISVTKQGEGGIVQQITAVGEGGKIVVETENKIRRALGGSGYTIKKQDGTVIDSTKLLPSAFFAIKKEGERYIINGGGYGHGIGMSQNGANEMAKAGKNYKDILKTFYTGVEIQ